MRARLMILTSIEAARNEAISVEWKLSGSLADNGEPLRDVIKSNIETQRLNLVETQKTFNFFQGSDHQMPNCSAYWIDYGNKQISALQNSLQTLIQEIDQGNSSTGINYDLRINFYLTMVITIAIVTAIIIEIIAIIVTITIMLTPIIEMILIKATTIIIIVIHDRLVVGMPGICINPGFYQIIIISITLVVIILIEIYRGLRAIIACGVTYLHARIVGDLGT